MTHSISPKQAVILCGGLGTRLRPLTNKLPKPMAPVHGKPFLYYLITQIRSQGIQRVLLLTGYLGDLIQEYFEDGQEFGVEIQYSCGPVEWETGRRLWEARDKIEPTFLLLYSDNYAQFNLNRLLRLHFKSKSAVTLSLAPKDVGNISVTQQGIVKVYDQSRRLRECDHVELGYMIVEKKYVIHEMQDLSGFPEFNLSSLLEKLAAAKQLSGLVIRSPYHSISDPDRLDILREYIRPKKVILIDRDGTINKKADPGQYITAWTDFELISDTLNAMIRLSHAGFSFIVITNQAGVARDLISLDELNRIHNNMLAKLASHGINVLKVYFSPAHWDDDSYDRKPQPGLFFRASQDYQLRLDNILYIGDDERDCIAAANAGCGMVYLSQSSKTPDLEEYPCPFIQSTCLSDCVDSIQDTYKTWSTHQ